MRFLESLQRTLIGTNRQVAEKRVEREKNEVRERIINTLANNRWDTDQDADELHVEATNRIVTRLTELRKGSMFSRDEIIAMGGELVNTVRRRSMGAGTLL